jgi:hypothetical protein
MEDFERCFERNYGDIARFCARRAATAEDAEDAATEVFAVAWRRRGDLPPPPDDGCGCSGSPGACSPTRAARSTAATG